MESEIGIRKFYKQEKAFNERPIIRKLLNQDKLFATFFQNYLSLLKDYIFFSRILTQPRHTQERASSFFQFPLFSERYCGSLAKKGKTSSLKISHSISKKEKLLRSFFSILSVRPEITHINKSNSLDSKSNKTKISDKVKKQKRTVFLKKQLHLVKNQVFYPPL
jgi:hypothetical protein